MIESAVAFVPVLVVIAGVFRPWAGLALLGACLPLFGSPPGGPYLTALDLAAVAAIAPALTRGDGRPSRLDLPVLGFVLVSLVTMLPLAWRPPDTSATALLGLVGALPGIESWSLAYSWRAALDLLLGVGLFLAVRRTFATSGPGPLGRALAVGLGGAVMLGLAEHSGLVDLGAYRPIGWAMYDMRLHSLFFHAGWFAEFVVIAGPFAVAALAAGRRGRGAAVGLAGLCLLALPFTEARGAWIAAAAALATIAALGGRGMLGDRRRLRRLIALPVIAALAASALFITRPAVLAPVLDRASQLDLSGRTGLWRSALAMARDRPFLGWGLGTFNAVYDTRVAVDDPDWTITHATAHNLYVMVAAERGLIGLAALLTLLGAAALALRGPLAGSGGERRMALGLGGSLVGLAVYGLVQYVPYVRALHWLIWMILGCVASLAPARRAGRGALAGLVAVAIALACVRLVATPAPPGIGDREYGYHALERDADRTWRWTTGRTGQRLRWQGQTLVLTLANGHPRPSRHRPEVRVRWNGRTVATLHPGTSFAAHRVVVGPPAAAHGLLTLEVTPTFRPFSDHRQFGVASRDIRSLGVAVADVEWQR